MSIDLKALIEKQRAAVAKVRSDDVEIMVGGELVALTVEKVHPDVWDELMMRNPARHGSDSDTEAGYNTKAVTLAYPRLILEGEALDAATRAELYADLDSTWRNALSIVIWGVNVNGPLSEMRALGKARAGRKSPSPAN